LLDLPFDVFDGATWESDSARKRVARDNPMRQIPTLVFPDGPISCERANTLLQRKRSCIHQCP
jgi:GST-like protein